MKRNFLVRAIDAAVAVASPAAALGRERARFALDAVRGLTRKYEAAGLGRRTDGWRTTSSGPNSELRPAIRLLRDRSRDLVRNNPFAKRAVQVIGTNVVGLGIKPAAVLDNAKQAKKVNADWAAWAGSSTCDFDGLLDFYGLQRSVIRGAAESGEVLIIRKRLTPEEMKKYSPFVGFQLQILEADFIDSGRDGLPAEGGGRIVQGVEFDPQGRRVAYWLFKSHPGENTIWGDRTSVRVPAEDVLHIFEPLRPGQVRGVPMGASAMLRLRDFDEYEDAQLIRQKIAACFAMFYSGSDTGGGLANDLEDVNQGDLPTRMEPGMIEKLPQGSTVEFGTPPAAEGYETYSKTVLQSVAVGFGITYEQLTGDYSNVNYSSARMARQEFGGYIAELQALIITQFCAKVWDWYMSSAYLYGRVKSAKTPARWTVPAREMVDPVKEVKALRDAVRAGFSSWSDAVLSLGYNPDELREALKADAVELKKLGLSLTTDAEKYADNGVPIAQAAASEPKP